MHSDASHVLTQHAKRTLALPQLPPYATDAVRAVVREVRELDAAVAALLAPFRGRFSPGDDPATACAALVHHLTMRRDKRCLLAYHRVRVGKLEEMVWQGRAGEVEQGNDEGRGGGSLSPEEEDYVRRYGELLAAFKGQWTDVDLTGSLEPPRDLFIDVRVLKDAGEIQTEYGSINLTKNSQFYVRQGDVDRLIAQGYLQRLD